MKKVSEKIFVKELNKNDNPVLVDFCAKWCGPCLKLKPILEDIDNTRSGFEILRVDVDDNPNLIRKYQIDSIPTLMIFKKGRPLYKHTGYISKKNLEEILEKFSI